MNPNSLYFGGDLDILRQHIADDSVDLIYFDPPFNSNATYSVLFRERSGEESAAQVTAFDDTWRWNIESELAYQDVVTQHDGIDGYINFFDDNSGEPKRIVVQVKSGGVQRNKIATLKSDMEREKADLALFVTLKPPTRPMEQEALEAGFYAPEAFPDHQFPRVQILTIEDLLSGAQPQYPRYAPTATFLRAPRRLRQG